MTLSRPYPARIAELERSLEITRIALVDTDHACRIRDDECRRLHSEASELMAENADCKLLIADLRQRLDWHTENAKRQGEEIERLRMTLEATEAADRLSRLTIQQDLPPTRAEEYDGLTAARDMTAQANKGLAKRIADAARRIATEANEERN